MANKLQTHIEKIKKFNNDRTTWLRLSGFVVISIILIVIDWTIIGNEKIHWVLISTGLILSVAWWYWTMRLVRELLNNKLSEMEILSDIVNDIKEIKDDIKKIDQRS